jgi:hypothetical protein
LRRERAPEDRKKGQDKKNKKNKKFKNKESK